MGKKILIIGALCLTVELLQGIEPLATQISQTGKISFKLHTDKLYRNGKGQEKYRQSLLKLPGICEIVFTRTNIAVNLYWVWYDRAGFKKFNDIAVDFSDLPGPESYFFQFTWDSARGVSEGYFNGCPLRIPGARFAPWWVKNVASKVEIGSGSLKITDLKISSIYASPKVAMAAVPDKYRGKHSNLLGFLCQPVPIDVYARRGQLLYTSLMDSPKSIKDWVKEGPIDLSFEKGFMLMRSKDFAGNTVFWCPQDFPESFVASWDVEILSHYGLAIVFFAARGEKGKDIFNLTLPKRDGQFKHYILGAINSYHISYFANIENYQMGRTDSNLRKNNKFYRVGNGPIAIRPDTKGWQHICLVKDGNHIQLYNNGKIYMDWTDNNPKRYGLSYGGGKIGLRQMAPTIGRYRNFRVWELKKKN
jgi:Domain of unknown function (DUF1961)